MLGPKILAQIIPLGLEQENVLAGAKVVRVRPLPAHRGGGIRGLGRAGRNGGGLLLTVKILLQGQRLEQLVLRFQRGEPLIEPGQVMARSIPLILQHDNAVGPLKFNHFLLPAAQLGFQPHDVLVQPLNRVVGGAAPHLLLEVDILLHAGLHKRLGGARLGAAAPQKKDGGLGKDVHFELDRLDGPVRVGGGHPGAGAVPHNAALHEGRLGAQKVV